MNTIRAEHVIKEYPGVTALNDVSVEFTSGKIHAFVGKNGSGKSTLLKIFSGATQPTSGHIYFNDEELICRSPSDASKVGLATVYQELSVIPGISVAENILMGRLPETRLGLVNWKETYAAAKRLLDELEIDIDPKARLETLPVSERQMVEIAKAVSQKPKVLALDEPTSALSQTEVKALFRLLRRLKEQGDIVIIYVSHRLQELWEIADTCTVLRDGSYIGTVELGVTSRQEILNMMFGSVQVKTRPADLKASDETVLKITDLCREEKFEHISFELKRGEVLGIAGLLGSGRTELLRSIFGADSYDSGTIEAFGKVVTKPTPEKMRDLGIGMVQEDRGRDGLILEDSISLNMMLAVINKMGKGIFYDKKLMRKTAAARIQDLHIKLGSIEDKISSLSGGNQQKVIVGRWINAQPQIIFFDEPSRGIDVAAKQQIFEIIWELSRQGVSTIVVSSELEELIEVCTRILIIRNGQLIGEAAMDNLTIDELYMKCMGD